MSSPGKVILISSDGVRFEVDKAVAIQCETIKAIIDEGEAGNVFTLHYIDSCILARVIEYLEMHCRGTLSELVLDVLLSSMERSKKKYAATAVAAAAATAYTHRKIRKEEIKSWEAKEKLKNWDAKFVNVDKDTLVKLIRAADYLNIPGLLDLTKQALYDRFVGKIEIPEDICMMFDISNDLRGFDINNDHPSELDELI